MFTFEVQAADLFAERRRQFAGWGIPQGTVARVERRIDDVWAERPGGWCTEWCTQARHFEAEGAPLRAALCYGAARFPFACTDERRLALESQVRTFVAAAARFRCRFERLELDVPFHGQTTRVPVHLYRPRRSSAGVVVLSGGVDTYKMELHRLAMTLVRLAGLSVAAIDMPGTGESRVPLSPDADAIYRGVIARVAGGGKVGFWGISFGGYWAARLALQGDVQCAVDLGGPLGSAPDGRSLLSLPHGMPGILGNAAGLERLPTEEELDELLREFSLERRGLLSASEVPVPLLAVNGTHDQYIPRRDTAVFAGMRNATALLVPRTTHCAAEALPRVVPTLVAWLARQLSGAPVRAALLGAAARAVAPRYERP